MTFPHVRTAPLNDPALAALSLAFDRDPILSGYRQGPGFILRASGPVPGFEAWQAEQTFRPAADRLKIAGVRVTRSITGLFPIGVVMVTQHKEEVLANIARAWSHLERDGLLVIAGENGAGVKSVAKQASSALPPGRRESLRKSVIQIHQKTNAGDGSDLGQWTAGGHLRKAVEDRYWTQPGMFSWKAVDKGSAVLSKHLPESLSGRVADLGAGWGYLSFLAAERMGQGDRLDLFEAELLALKAARQTISDAAVLPTIRYRWLDVLRAKLPRRAYDHVVMNPPFHVGQTADLDIGRSFIQRASEMLKPGGKLHMVANRHLPYERDLERHFRRVDLVAEDPGFKVFRAGR